MQKFRGLRWYKCDLHLHTTASECFSDKTVTAEQWVQKCIDEGLHCIAVTDHNTGNGIDAIKTAAEGKIVVFPGVEVTCGDSKQHVLILFDPSKDSSYVNEFLNLIEIFEEDRAKETTSTTLSIFDVAKKASSRGGIAIAAHIDQFSGLSPLSYENKGRVCSDKNILGVQVVHDFLYQETIQTDENLQILFDNCYNDVQKNIWEPWLKTANFYKNKEIAKLTFSDNPAAAKDSKHGLYGIGSRFTWIKMDEEITIQSLKQAMLMPKIRIMNDFDFKSATKFYPTTYIKELDIVNTIYNIEDPSIINFNPQLTTIIGGRGTGKSGILRMIRNSLDKVEELDNHEDILKDHSEFCCKNTGDLGVFTSQTKTSMKIVDGESNYILNFDFNDGKPKYDLTVVYSNGESTVIQPSEIKSFLERLNINLFSQKQIYEIAKRPDALRTFIDSSIPDLESKMHRLNTLKNNYRINLSKILEYEDTLSKKSSLEVELKKFEIIIEKIDIPIVIEILDNDKKFTEENKTFQTLLQSICMKIELLQGVLNTNVDLLNKEQFREEYEEEITQINANIQGYISSHNEILIHEIKSLTDFKDTLVHNFSVTGWNKDLLEHKAKLETKQREQGDIKLLLAQRKDISEKIERINKELEDLKEIAELLLNLQYENQQNLSSILEIRKEIRNLRQTFINKVLGDNHLLKGNVKAYRDFKHYEQKLREYLVKPTGFDSDFDKIIEYLKAGNTPDKLKELVEVFKNISIDNPIGLSGRFTSFIKKIDKSKIEYLSVFLPEDEVVMLYKTNEAGDFKPLSNASAGQKTSAILTLILSIGDSPLILDQPEDDLDNSLIYSLIVDRIIKSKSNRQIIIVTHNANIPVNADSDLVNVMDSDILTFKPKNSDSIDNHDIKESICSIMEGGISAFRSRALKYDLEFN